MSLSLDQRLLETGTKFRLFAQARYLPSFKNPETIIVSLSPNKIQPGPADERMFVVNAIDKKPYSDGGGDPQFSGRQHPPVRPNASGHFDEIDVDSPEFSCATMYATVRRVLDIWEDYFGHEIPWIFADDFKRIELIPLIEYDNAFSGYGYLEFGFGRLPGTPTRIDRNAPFCQNFDVLAHELGHNILFSVVGVPRRDHDTPAYGGFQESGADLSAIVASLHFNSVVDHLLSQSRGNLFSVNELSRLGELPNGREIRVAFNDEKISTVDTEPHNLSLPLTGALFDIFVEAFQKALVEKQLITPDLAKRSAHGVASLAALPGIAGEFARAYAGHESGFKTCLLEARDYLGRLLATTWSALSADDLQYDQVARAVVRADQAVTGGQNVRLIRECFTWREIAIGSTRQRQAARSIACLTEHSRVDYRIDAPAPTVVVEQPQQVV